MGEQLQPDGESREAVPCVSRHKLPDGVERHNLADAWAEKNACNTLEVWFTNLTSKFLSDFVNQHTNSQQLLVLSGRPVAQYGQQAQPFSCKSPPSPSHVNPSAGTCNKPYTV